MWALTHPSGGWLLRSRRRRPAATGHQPRLPRGPSRPPATSTAAARPPAAQLVAQPPPPWRRSAASLRNSPRQVCACCWLRWFRTSWTGCARCALFAAQFPVLTLCTLACPALPPCKSRCLLASCMECVLTHECCWQILSSLAVLLGVWPWFSGSSGATQKSQIQEWPFPAVSGSPYKLVHLQRLAVWSCVPHTTARLGA